MKKGNILAIILIVAAVIAGYFFLKQFSAPTPQPSPQTSPSPSTQELKTYQSKDLKFSIQIPKNYEIEEKFTSVVFKMENDEIILSRVATNFSDLPSYLGDVSSKNNFTLINRESKIINGLNSTIGNVKSATDLQAKEKIYFIYSDNLVYSISTSSESLFSDLDQIAQSFRYIK